MLHKGEVTSAAGLPGLVGISVNLQGLQGRHVLITYSYNHSLLYTVGGGNLRHITNFELV